MKPLVSYPCKVSSFSPSSVPILLAWSAGFPAGLLLPGFTLLFGAAVLLDGRFFWLAPV